MGFLAGSAGGGGGGGEGACVDTSRVSIWFKYLAEKELFLAEVDNNNEGGGGFFLGCVNIIYNNTDIKLIYTYIFIKKNTVESIIYSIRDLLYSDAK